MTHANDPELPPPTMPDDARTGRPPTPPGRAQTRTDDGQTRAAGIPAGTGPRPVAAEVTSEATPSGTDADPAREVDEDERPSRAPGTSPAS